MKGGERTGWPIWQTVAQEVPMEVRGWPLGGSALVPADA